MKNLHLIPTDKPSRLGLHKNGALELHSNALTKNLPHYNPQHIYITSDEEIKEGDWCLFESSGVIRKVVDSTFSIGVNNIRMYAEKKVFKIILTTDQDLIKDGIQAIDDEFLEWFVQNPSCEWVEVERVVVYDDNNYGNGEIFHSNRKLEYKIIIPQEEPKQEHCDCKRAYKEALSGICELCWDEKYPTKQETLEEASKKYAELSYYGDEVDVFVNGAKWQSDRMYSEDEVFRLTLDALDLGMRIRQDQLSGHSQESGKELHKDWFEQFKKK